MKPIISLVLTMLFAVKTYGNPPSLNLELSDVTVSGLSSGGYMANQFHISHSDWVSGAGIIAAGPYFCAQGSISTALSMCVNKLDAEIPLEAFDEKLIAYQNSGLIAPLTYLKNSRVWLMHGTLDTKVIRPVMDTLHKQYARLTESKNLRYLNNKPFAHHFPTLSNGKDCSRSESPFLGNCNYDAAGEMLTFLIKDLSPPNAKAKGKLLEIDQHKLAGDTANSLAKRGFIYVPDTCIGKLCKLHINFHGCNQNAQSVGQEYVKNNGLNLWADANQLVVLYPQTNKSLMMPLNPQGCWDWWGYTDENYANKNGPQIQAVQNMVLALNNDQSQ